MAVPAFITTLQGAVPDSVSHVSYYVGDWTIVVPLEQMTAALTHLRDAPDAAFDFCSDVTATDWPPRKEARFDLDLLPVLHAPSPPRPREGPRSARPRRCRR